jgi:hypothetical protein
MKKNKMYLANLLSEQRHLSSKLILREYDEKIVESKRNEIISNLESLKAAQTGMLASVKKSEIDKQIKEVQSINTKKVCNGKELDSEVSKKLSEAENKLKEYDSQLEDCKDGCKGKLKAHITFIREFCGKQDSSTTSSQTGNVPPPSDNTTQTTTKSSSPTTQTTTISKKDETPNYWPHLTDNTSKYSKKMKHQIIGLI